MDQVLAAPSQVVADRAQVVAADTIARQLEKDVCGSSLTLPKRTPHAPARFVIRLGGSEACQPPATRATETTRS